MAQLANRRHFSCVHACATTALALGLLIGMQAVAEPAGQARLLEHQARVSYGDLDVDRERGADVLYMRLKVAVDQVCRPLEGRAPRQRLAWRACRQEAMESAVAQINLPQLTAIHYRRTDRVAPAPVVAGVR